MKRTIYVGVVICVLLWINTIVFAHDDYDSIEQFDESVTVTEIACTLTDGTKMTCYEIVSTSLPSYEIGSFCPETLDDTDGIWEMGW